MDVVIFKYALKNAYDHGKAAIGPVINKVLGEEPERKKDMKKLALEVKEVVEKVNQMDPGEIEKILKEKYPELLQEKPQREGLPPLPNVKDKVILRSAPSPSGYLHIGHAYMLSINSEYARMYNGKHILRIEDTDPKTVIDVYDDLIEDAKWITGGKIDEIIIQSDRMEIYYKYAEELIKKGKAYVCTCKNFKEYIDKKESCPHRNQPIEKNLEEWKKMFTEYKEGDAVLRIKTDMKHPNPAMRDWVAFRIVEIKHIRKPNYRVWPMMNFAVAVDDHELGLTHVIRGKDHEDNTKKQAYIFDYLGWKKPVYIHHGRINLLNAPPLSKRKIKELIEKGELEGPDDIRLATLKALRRRGIPAEAIREFFVQIGPTKNDKTVDYDEFMKAIYKNVRKLLDKKAHRYFFVWEPTEIDIGISKEVEVPITPYSNEKRKIKVNEKVLVNKSDLNGEIRLIDLCNWNGKIVEDNLKAKKVQWVPADENVNVKVLKPKGMEIEVIEGFAEKNLANEPEGVVVQFERFGFVKIEKKNENEIVCIFTSL